MSTPPYGYPDWGVPLSFLTGLQPFQATNGLLISTAGDTTLETIPLGSTFLLYWLCITFTCDAGPGVGGSFGAEVQVSRGLDGASGQAVLCQAVTTYAANQIVNMDPLTMTTPIPIKGSTPNNLLRVHIAYFGTVPATIGGELTLVGVML